MKLGIITLPLHTNYGGILQAYALQTILEQLGHKVYVIETIQEPIRLPLWKKPFAYGSRILKNIAGHPFPIFYEQQYNREKHILREKTDRFINKYINRKIVNDFSEIKETDFDAIIVGSDQVWRPKYFKKGITHAYLDFTNGWNIKRIAFSASFGTSCWEYNMKQTRLCKELIHNFDAISVREDSGVNLCREHFGVKALVTLDPTMLLPKEFYIQIFKNYNVPKHPSGLLNYILDETQEKMNIINKIAKSRKLKPFRVNTPSDIHLPIEERIALPVEQWIRGFYDAEFVITDSFHACVFSILFNKPFIVIGNSERGMSRFTSILSILGLTHRLVKSETEIDKIINQDIDWKSVNSKKEDYIKYSLDYLNKNI